MKIQICRICGKKFKPTHNNHIYCGNRKTKGTCSYNRLRERAKKYSMNFYWKKKGASHKFCKKCGKEIPRETLKRLCENCLIESKKEQWRKKNQRRLKLRVDIFRRDKFTCKYCGRKSPDVILEIDHIHPRSKGGLNNQNNYQTLCKDCNIGKGDYIL